MVGIEVHLSGNHTLNGKKFHDICDELQGKYPKEFKFTGWHPQCRCYATSILKTPEEIAEDNRRLLRGEPVSDDSVNAVRDVPPAFKQWLADNAERIASAKSLPYFLRDNGTMQDGAYQLNDFGTAQSGAVEPNAEQLNAAMIDKLQEQAQNGFLPKEAVEKLQQIATNGTQAEFDSRAALLQAVAERHASRTGKQIADIEQRWEERKDLRQYTTEQIANFAAIERDLGIERGLSMTHIEANQDRPNPKYGTNKLYGKNCQSCVLTYELRRRGFDVETLPYTTAIQKRLAFDVNKLWFDPKTGTAPVPQIAGGGIEFKRNGAIKPKSKKVIAADFENLTAECGRYHMTVSWRGGKSGHIVTCERLKEGSLRIYDPQTGKLHNLQYFLDNIQTARGIRIVRVDGLQMVPTLTQVMKKSGTPTPRIIIESGSRSNRGKIVGASSQRDKERDRLYKRLSRNENYKNVQFNPQTGALKATHKEHNFDGKGGKYEQQAQDVGYATGHSVIFGKEDGIKKGKRFVEGLWDGLRFEVTGCETATSNNLLHGLSHCASKPNSDIAVLVFPNGGFDESVLQRSIGRFKGLSKYNPRQFHQFKRIICIQGNEIVYDEIF